MDKSLTDTDKQNLLFNKHTAFVLANEKDKFDNYTATVYLLINKLELQGIALRVHIDGYVPQTPGLILHQDRAL